MFTKHIKCSPNGPNVAGVPQVANPLLEYAQRLFRLLFYTHVSDMLVRFSFFFSGLGLFVIKG